MREGPLPTSRIDFAFGEIFLKRHAKLCEAQYVGPILEVVGTKYNAFDVIVIGAFLVLYFFGSLGLCSCLKDANLGSSSCAPCIMRMSLALPHRLWIVSLVA